MLSILRERLVTFVLAAPGAHAAAAADIEREGLWAAAVTLALRWGVLPQLAERLSSLPFTPAPEIVSEIHARTTEGYARSIVQAREGLALLRRFAEAKIPAAAIKGLVSLACLYEDPRQRVLADSDILIHEEDLPRAAEVLAGLGYRPAVEVDPRSYRQFLRRSPGFGGNEELAFHNTRGACIDLHWRLGTAFDVKALIARARPAVLLGATFSAVSPGDALLLCVHHAARNHFSPDLILRDLLDLDRWWASIFAAGQAEVVLQAAAAHGLLTPLLALKGILAVYRPSGAAADMAVRIEPAVSARQRQAAKSLRDLFAAQVREGQIERDLLYLFRPTETRQLLAAIFFGGSRHLELARAMDAGHAGKPIRARERLAAIVRSLGGVRPRHIRMLRALARTKDEFAGRV